jgi:FliP family
MISELKRTFEIGFLLFLPFLIIDMVVASVLMSMGMMMLPPVTVSLPFKLIFFVLIDGWSPAAWCKPTAAASGKTQRRSPWLGYGAFGTKRTFPSDTPALNPSKMTRSRHCSHIDTACEGA